MANDNDEYEVGRGKPPKWTQFQKGKSGNPKGRPRKKTAPDISSESEMDDILRRALAREVVVKQGNETRKISTKEALVAAQIKTAAGGSAHAQREIMSAARRLEECDAARAQLAEERERQDFENAVIWRQRQTRLWDEAAKEDREPDDPWPHPDDIIVDKRMRKFRVRGPIDEGDLPRYEYYRTERDAAFFAHIISLRTSRIVDRSKLVFWKIVWITWDAYLPLRWQNLRRVEALEFYYLCQPLRKLRKAEAYLRDEVEELKMRANILPPGKETYREVNAIMKPLLKRQGYHSLAEFERAYDLRAGNPPWPKLPGGA